MNDLYKDNGRIRQGALTCQSHGIRMRRDVGRVKSMWLKHFKKSGALIFLSFLGKITGLHKVCVELTRKTGAMELIPNPKILHTTLSLPFFRVPLQPVLSNGMKRLWSTPRCVIVRTEPLSSRINILYWTKQPKRELQQRGALIRKDDAQAPAMF